MFGLEGEGKGKRGYCAGKNIQIECAWAQSSRPRPVTPNLNSRLPQEPQVFLKLGTIPVFGTLTHLQSCIQDAQQPDWLGPELLSGVLNLYSTFQLLVLWLWVWDMSLFCKHSAWIYLSRIYYLRFSGIKSVPLLHLFWHCKLAMSEQCCSCSC